MCKKIPNLYKNISFKILYIKWFKINKKNIIQIIMKKKGIIIICK